jgi:hypothetical protein
MLNVVVVYNKLTICSGDWKEMPRGTNIPGYIDEESIRLASAKGVILIGGHLNKKDGRVRIFSREFPGTTKCGYCLRSRIVWWAHTGEVLSGCEFNIHHKNHDRADDRFDNLEKISHSEHSKHHHPLNAAKVSCKCINCRSVFILEAYRMRDAFRGKFCSAKCFHSYPRSEEHKKKISAGLFRAWKMGRTN